MIAQYKQPKTGNLFIKKSHLMVFISKKNETASFCCILMAFCQSIVKDWALTLNLLVLSNLASLKQSNKNCVLNCQMSEMAKK